MNDGREGICHPVTKNKQRILRSVYDCYQSSIGDSKKMFQECSKGINKGFPGVFHWNEKGVPRVVHGNKKNIPRGFHENRKKVFQGGSTGMKKGVPRVLRVTEVFQHTVD